MLMLDSHWSDNKYPRLELNDEELKMATKENMKFPTHYPLTREEERNLKKIRRKIRNKLSAQDSRKRKREYLDNMEDRVKAASDENQELQVITLGNYRPLLLCKYRPLLRISRMPTNYSTLSSGVCDL